jgi:cysteine desulfurase
MHKRVYLDHAAATPVDPGVLRAMEPYWTLCAGNPSAVHAEGVAAQKAVASSRARIATLLGARPDEIIFTSGATESANLALVGAVRAWRVAHPNRTPHLVISAIEHAAVIEAAEMLRAKGARVDILPCNAEGVVSPEMLAPLLSVDTVLVSVMLANNEIGTIQPLAQYAKVIRKWKRDIRQVTRDMRARDDDRYPLLHSDATQAMNYLPVEIPSLGVDMLTWNAAKIYGPKGIGALFVARGTPLTPLIVGGGHERGVRAGTENVPGIVGFAEALAQAVDMRDGEAERLRELRDEFLRELQARFSDMIVNGTTRERLPNNINISFPDIDHEFLVLALDARGFAVSAKSACGEQEFDVSHVLVALREAEQSDAPRSGLRITLGRGSDRHVIPPFVEALVEIRATMSFVA